MKRIALVTLATVLSGCVTTTDMTTVSGKASGPKELIVLTKNDPVAKQVVSRLRARGFKVKFLPPNVRTTDDVRYGLSIEWDAMERCFAGGYAMRSYDAALYDLRTNEPLFEISRGGYTEGCAPLSGTTFKDTADGINGLWG